jgi:molybdopterin molybdotransferase
MISISEAIQLVLGRVRSGTSESVGVSEACGSTLAEDLQAGADVPGFRNSQMDGFAVRASDLSGASTRTPVILQAGETVAAGSGQPGRLPPAVAIPIMTGAALPDDADAVVPIENTRSVETGIEFTTSPDVDAFVRQPGMDLRQGETVLQRGRILRPADIGLLASLGCEKVLRTAGPRVAILGTGDELVEVGKPLGFGQIHDSNAYVLAAAAAETGAVPTRLGIIPDDRASLEAAFEATTDYDLVLSTGGVSVGKFDYVKEVLDGLGVDRLFWKVAQKPGKPVTFGQHSGGALFFGLPGNPVSAMVCFELYVAPAIRAILGQTDVFRPTIEVELGEDIRTTERFEELVRCKRSVESGHVLAYRAGSQNSGALHSLSHADCLVISPPGQGELSRGERTLALDLTAGSGFSTQHPFS